ncbi:DNA-directed RNA polymerase, mitochondrial [Prorops nasuta]|uniref:DNA-directed RNA polymerase, mitochondrial n=1 Tax=Prorops nasuta TaxID=863751 RepID=UPI0034D00891
MYRFLKSHSTSIHNVYRSSLPENMQSSTKVCSFCNFCHQNLLKYNKIMQQKYCSTVPNKPELLIKKELKKKKKFAELLEVNDRTSSNIKASVKKLNANCISLLIDHPEIALDQLHKINSSSSVKSAKQQIKRNVKNKKDRKLGSDNVQLTDSNDLSNTESYIDKTNDLNNFSEDIYNNDLLMNDLMNQIEGLNADMEQEDLKLIKTGELKKKQPKLSEEKNANDREILSTENLDKILACIQVYIDVGKVRRAEYLLLQQRKPNRKLYRVDSMSGEFVKGFNLLLDFYAAKGNLTKVLELYKFMKKDSKHPNVQSYSYILECIGRNAPNDTTTEILRSIECDMKAKQISFNSIYTKTILKNNQQEAILKAIKQLDPNFKPLSHCPELSYDCSLLKNIQNTKISKPAVDYINKTTLHHALRNQICAERQGVVKVKSIVNNNSSEHESRKKRIEELESRWEKKAAEAFDQNLFYLKQQENSPILRTLILHPFLEILPKPVYVHAIMTEVKTLADNDGTHSKSLIKCYANLGLYIFKKYKLSKAIQDGILDKKLDAYFKYLDWYLDGKSGRNHRLEWQKCIIETNNSEILMTNYLLPWPRSICLQIGEFLYNIIFNDLKVEINNDGKGKKKVSSYPAFFAVVNTSEKSLLEQVKPHPYVSKQYKQSVNILPDIEFTTDVLPSLVPPCPWTGIQNGGYFFTPSDFMRTTAFSKACYKRLYKTPPEQLNPIFDVLNQQSSVPWKINTDLLDIVIDIFRKGGNEDLKIPKPINSFPPFEPKIPDDGTSESKKSLYSERLAYINDLQDSYSLWCDALYKLSIANHLRDKIFWLPQNIDFRGRVYSIPPHLSHLGNDLARSVLLFAEGRKLGPHGIDWLKIHLVNLLGCLKRNSIQERLQYANDHIDLIQDSADNPLTGKMWWTNSDDPWQTLAACKEVVAALKSPNPAEFVSHLPIHQDGSCNGLQHYAALGRDQPGAISVNLAPSDVPQDVYSSVVTLVEQQRKIDADNGNKIANLLDGHLNRKVIKQTVMTTVYGVTQYGATIQILKRLKEKKQFEHKTSFEASRYLVEKTFGSLRTMFNSAKQIQDWFNKCANVITNSNKEVEWITPLGLPVVQPYFKLLQYNSNNTSNLKVDKPKQRNGFAPNFIHSLDSSHMMLTSLHTLQEGITFISVHDCYWTHPCTVDIMNRICRDQFIALHSEPILENLSNFFKKTYGESLLRPGEIKVFDKIPKKGTFDLNQIRSSVYFFS